ncbi:MAG: DNA polymerase III subunit gamma/tau, partial [Pseudomonadota bacterium]|nr:DNA polymerase III subunit gamma/tau [Pseudomonadota bacterium]
PAAAIASPPAREPEPPPAQPVQPALDADRWLELVANAGLSGPAGQLAAHAAFLGCDGSVLRLGLSPAFELLKSPASTRALVQALAPALGHEPQLRFESIADAASETLHQRSTRERDARQEAAEASFMADPGVQQLITRHGATLVPDTIRPHDE